ncbi:MAG TPA: hypothetical protein VNJ02_18725 [Vicinamibacterales bacterium]|nr:hypothetical protein [Vicinamibacterales bacterium]
MREARDPAAARAIEPGQRPFVEHAQAVAVNMIKGSGIEDLDR